VKRKEGYKWEVEGETINGCFEVRKINVLIFWQWALRLLHLQLESK
jgi:hypothetical protein